MSSLYTIIFTMVASYDASTSEIKFALLFHLAVSYYIFDHTMTYQQENFGLLLLCLD